MSAGSEDAAGVVQLQKCEELLPGEVGRQEGKEVCGPQVKVKSSLVTLKITEKPRIWRKVRILIKISFDETKLTNKQVVLDLHRSYRLVAGDQTEVSRSRGLQVCEGQGGG